MWGFLGWKVNLISFPTSTHGPSYLLGIKSYSYFFWWSELVVRSDLVLFWVRSGALSSYVHLSTINVEHLGSITSLEVIKAQSVRNKFTCSCSFLARRLVSGPWFVSLMLNGEFLTFEVSCTVWRHIPGTVTQRAGTKLTTQPTGSGATFLGPLPTGPGPGW